MLVSGRKQPPYAVIPVGYGLPHPAVATDMTFDLTQEHIYVLTGDVVSWKTPDIDKYKYIGTSYRVCNHYSQLNMQFFSLNSDIEYLIGSACKLHVIC